MGHEPHTTPVGPEGGIGHTGDPPTDQGSAPELSGPVGPSVGRIPRHRVGSLVAGSIVCALAVVMLAGSGWALWMDRVDRDASGFVPIGTTSELRTETYAIVSDVHGDAPAGCRAGCTGRKCWVPAARGSPRKPTTQCSSVSRARMMYLAISAARVTPRSGAGRPARSRRIPATRHRFHRRKRRFGPRRRQVLASRRFCGSRGPVTGASS